jgi:hypothetical protein
MLMSTLHKFTKFIPRNPGSLKMGCHYCEATYEGEGGNYGEKKEVILNTAISNETGMQKRIIYINEYD